MEKSEKPIDAVRMMRDIRERMSREMEGLSREELLRYINEGWRPEPASAKAAAGKEHAA